MQSPVILVGLLFLLSAGGCVGQEFEPSYETRRLLELRQTEAVTALATRLLKKDVARFKFSVMQDQQLPRLSAVIANTDNNSVTIVGNSGVAAAWGLHYYLTQYCSAMVTWSGAQVALPASSLPEVPDKLLNLTAQDVFTVMPNLVTFSYSYVWWRFPEWEAHIDWMALHGVNLALALTGQEKVFRNVFLKFGLTNEDIEAYFPGPAFQAWGRMGNIKGWGGPLPQAWIEGQAALQKQILQRMTSLGMTPVLQGFSGMVPDAFEKKYPHVNYTRLSDWNQFGENYSEVYFVDPQNDMFRNLSEAIVNEHVKLFGQVTHYYAMDPYNEVLPSEGDPDFLKAVSAAIYEGFLQADPKGVWVLESWFLNSAPGFWTQNRTRAFFEPVEKDHLLIVEMWGEIVGLAEKFDGFFGHNFVWTALHNFGGNNAMFGSLQHLMDQGPFQLRQKFPDNFLGGGIQPEGIGQNEVFYEFVMEFNWRAEPVNLTEWIRDYARRRYGRDDSNLQDAWQLLLETLYSHPSSGYELISLLVLRPSLSLGEDNGFNDTIVEQAWRLLIATNQSDNVLLNYDQVDLTRQMLQIRFYEYYNVLKTAAAAEDAPIVEIAGIRMLAILDSMDQLLQTDAHFLLQRQISQARSFGVTPTEKWLYEQNVRLLLTSWGPGPYPLTDYAAKMYNGLISHYYRPRWELFLQQLTTAVLQKLPFDENRFVQDVYTTVERPFYLVNSTTGPDQPTGSPYSAVKRVKLTLPTVPGAFLQAKAEERNFFQRLWLASQGATG